MASECVKVMVRCRPMNKKEKERGCLSVVDVDVKENNITLHKPGDPEQSKMFSYDYTFGSETAQQTIYETTAFSLIESVAEGYNGTIFAYGQTGCGKTHTMLGDPQSEVEKGIIPRSFQHIMNIVSNANNKQFLVRCSYLEIYNEDIRDLLGADAKAKIELKESPEKGVFVKDLTQTIVKNVEEMEKWMIHGTKNRSVGETLMNKDSSRSHSIFTLYIEASINDELGNERYTAGKLNLVDLAGSERQSKTGATGDRLKEATKINLSLSALGNVISALVDGKSTHVPYRDSKLTRLLQDSLGGNTKTIMIAAVSPADYNYDETLSTLRYASRAKNIKNKPTVNEDPKDAMLREYADEIKKLKDLLIRQQKGEKIDFQAEMMTSQNLTRGDPLMQGQIENMKSELEEKAKKNEEALIKEQEERKRLEDLLNQLQTKVVKGGQGDEKSKQKYQKLKNNLKSNEEQKQQLMREKEKAENEVLNLNKKFSNLEQENQELKKMVSHLKKKYKNAQSDIQDIERENELEKEDYLDLIRMQEKEIKIYLQISQMLLKPEEIEIIKSQSEWNDEKKEFKVPYFYFKEKKLKFPKIQAQDIVEQEKENRELGFQQSFSQGFGNGHYQEEYDRVDEMRQTNMKFMIRQTNKTLYQPNGNHGGPIPNGTKNSFYNGDARPTYEYDPMGGSRAYKQAQKDNTKVPKVQLDPLEHEARIMNQNNFQNGKNLQTNQNGNQPKHPKTAQLEPLNYNAEIQNQSQMSGTRNNFYNNSVDENGKNKQGRGVRLESIQSQNHMRNISQNSQAQYDASYDQNRVNLNLKNNKQLNPLPQKNQNIKNQ